jgi:hypothetical protein
MNPNQCFFGRVGVRSFDFLQFFKLKTYDFNTLKKKLWKECTRFLQQVLADSKIIKDFLQIFTFIYDL